MIAIIFGPFVVALLVLAPISALITVLGVAGAAVSATQSSSGFAPKRSAANCGAATLPRLSPPLLKRCRRLAGRAPGHWRQRALGSPSSRDFSHSQLSPAHGSSARRGIRDAVLAAPNNTQQTHRGLSGWVIGHSNPEQDHAGTEATTAMVPRSLRSGCLPTRTR